MDPEDVGLWRFCPACGRPSDGLNYDNNYEAILCSCCDRPWVACPCTPALDGECKSEVK